MADQYWRNYVQIPDQAPYTRAGLKAVTVRALQMNADHIHGTRVQQLVSDIDMWVLPPAAFPAAPPAAQGWPDYHVTVSEGVTRLWGTVVWLGWGSPGAEARMGLRFYSERGGAGVAEGLDWVTSSAVSLAMNAQENVWRQHPTLDDMSVRRGRGTFWGAGARPAAGNAQWAGGREQPEWLSWEPNLTNSREQRIIVQTQDETPGGVTTGELWGVAVYEQVPME